jgi:hypothetical protein
MLFSFSLKLHSEIIVSVHIPGQIIFLYKSWRQFFSFKKKKTSFPLMLNGPCLPKYS